MVMPGMHRVRGAMGHPGVTHISGPRETSVWWGLGGEEEGVCGREWAERGWWGGGNGGGQIEVKARDCEEAEIKKKREKGQGADCPQGEEGGSGKGRAPFSSLPPTLHP